MGIFLNLNRFNLVYGVFSRLIVLLLEVYIFFIYILFFAELIYVLQYFDILLLGELYLMPENEASTILEKLKRKIFINPNYILRHQAQMKLFVKQGNTIFSQHEISNEVFYILNGTVQLNRNNQLTQRKKGDFFGETGCIFGMARTGEAKALTDCQLMRIPSEKFWELIDKDPRITVKVLSQTSEYFSNLYGRKGSFLL